MAHIVSGALKDYDWGVVDGLARWHAVTGAPQAELWFGTHPAGPAVVVEGAAVGRTLDDLPEHRGMPMVKLLAASTPLSIQVHPDARMAERGFGAGSPLYADGAEKAEMLVALSPFDIHAGWRDATQAARVLELAGAPDSLVARVRSGDKAGALREVLGLDRVTCALIEPRLVAAATTAGWSSAAVSALARVAATHPADPGVLATVLLDHALLSPGEGVAVSAGVVHSYVAGLGVEVMTSSDNVLRLGLTSKTIAVEEALAAVHDDRRPVALRGFAGEVLAPPSMPFDLVIADDALDLPTGRHRLVLALHGAVRADGDDGSVLEVAEGRAAVWAPSEPGALIVPEGTAVVVTGRADQLPG